ncbi:hypothetical protein DSECCO2_120440 [anaerobic digester metagenome]
MKTTNKNFINVVNGMMITITLMIVMLLWSAYISADKSSTIEFKDKQLKAKDNIIDDCLRERDSLNMIILQKDEIIGKLSCRVKTLNKLPL